MLKKNKNIQAKTYFTDNTAELLPELRHSRKRVETVLKNEFVKFRVREGVRR